MWINDRIRKIFTDNEETIKNEVLANEIVYGAQGGTTKEWKINGESVILGTEKL